jgi:hypothetical protein
VAASGADDVAPGPGLGAAAAGTVTATETEAEAGQGLVMSRRVVSVAVVSRSTSSGARPGQGVVDSDRSGWKGARTAAGGLEARRLRRPCQLCQRGGCCADDSAGKNR